MNFKVREVQVQGFRRARRQLGNQRQVAAAAPTISRLGNRAKHPERDHAPLLKVGLIARTDFYQAWWMDLWLTKTAPTLQLTVKDIYQLPICSGSFDSKSRWTEGVMQIAAHYSFMAHEEHC